MGNAQRQVIFGKGIYSIGTSNRSLDEFISLLRNYGIETVVDVRSFPTSRFEHFKRDTLERVLQECGFAMFTSVPNWVVIEGAGMKNT